MEEDRQAGLLRQLEELDTSMGFLALLILSLALSRRAVGLQREALCRALRGQEGAAPDVFSLRLPASALVVGSLAYFFGLSLETWQGARGTGGREECSAQVNLYAALLMLAAGVLRLYDLVCLQGGEAQGQSSTAADSL